MPKGKLNIINRDRYHSFMKSPVTTYQTNKKVESVRFKMISHDEKYEEQKKKGIQIDITNPEIYVNNKKPIDGIFSPLFGADTTQDTPVYTCDCRKLVGGTNRGRICLNAELEIDENNNPIGWVYDEYTTEVEYTPNLQEEVEVNYDYLLAEAKANEKTKADLVADNEALQQENSKLKERQAFLEDCIAEMASQVYA